MSGPGPSCGYCQMNPCDHDGLWREYHDMERALREKDAEREEDRAAIRALSEGCACGCDYERLRRQHAAAIARAIA